MPMIDILVPEGLLSASSEAALLEQATTCLLEWERAGSVPLAVANTSAYLHVFPKARVTAGGKVANVVRVEVVGAGGTLRQEQRAEVTERLMTLVAELAGDPSIRDRTWIVFRDVVDGGWGADIQRPRSPESVSWLRRFWHALEVASS